MFLFNPFFLVRSRYHRQQQMGFTEVNVMGDRAHERQVVYSPGPESGEEVILIPHDQLHGMAF